MDGLPQLVEVRRIDDIWKGIALKAMLRGEICHWRQNRNIRLHDRLLKECRETSLVVRPQLEIGPPRIPLAEVSAISHPAGKWSIGRAVVEAVQDGLRDPGQEALVSGDLELFEGNVEWVFGIRHLLAADELLPGKMSGGRDEFGSHGVAAPLAVVGVAEGLDLRRPDPGFTFRDIDHHAGGDGIEVHSIGLHPRFDSVPRTPAGEGCYEPLMKELMLGSFEVVTNEIGLRLECRTKVRSISSADSIAHLSYFEEDAREPRREIVSPSLAELLRSE